MSKLHVMDKKIFTIFYTQKIFVLLHLSLNHILVYPCVYFRDEVQHIKLPRNIEDAKNLGIVLSRYKDKYFAQVLGGYFTTYILYPFKLTIRLKTTHCIDYNISPGVFPRRNNL